MYCLTFIADTVGKYGTEEKRIGRKGKKKLLSWAEGENLHGNSIWGKLSLYVQHDIIEYCKRVTTLTNDMNLLTKLSYNCELTTKYGN